MKEPVATFISSTRASTPDYRMLKLRKPRKRSANHQTAHDFIRLSSSMVTQAGDYGVRTALAETTVALTTHRYGTQAGTGCPLLRAQWSTSGATSHGSPQRLSSGWGAEEGQGSVGRCWRCPQRSVLEEKKREDAWAVWKTLFVSRCAQALLKIAGAAIASKG